MGAKNLLGILVVIVGILISISGCIEEKPKKDTQISTIKKFSSVEEFKSYLDEAKAIHGLYGQMYGVFDRVSVSIPESTLIAKRDIKAPVVAGVGVAPERVSPANVQVFGIDEPDIVKTDGRKIYFSSERVWWKPTPIIDVREDIGVAPPIHREAKTNIITAFPPADLALDSEIKSVGNLLLLKNILVIFSGQNIEAYDVSDSKNPKKKWSIKLEDGNSIVTARLYKDKIYLIFRNFINEYNPCPIKPLMIEERPFIIKCDEIYHPVLPVQTDVIFFAMVLDPVSGKTENKISFVGSHQHSVVYMSENAIYITYYYQESVFDFISKFLRERCRDIIPKDVLEKIEKLDGYNISQQAKLLELQIILEKYYRSLTNDERLRIANEMNNRMSDYYKKERRELEKSGIVKIELKNFKINATGSVPGFPLNQFALDEYEKNLRIATTVGERFGIFGFGMGRMDSANDVYILDENLKIIGSVKDMGKGERIYSVRFIGDKGYLVTFREIDPFYVLDLSNPQKPQVKGELKIPGYSAYLHPITNDKILGIGKEEWKVKISLFDVSDAENPKEVDKYLLDESWSDILSTHHAFLLDIKHEIFFIPGSKGGYIFSYKNGNLELIKAISGISARRAIYINDYLYIIGDDKIIVLDEKNWQRVNELDILSGYDEKTRR